MRVVIFGNSGSGKSTLARALCAAYAVPHLDLDSIAWLPGVRRRPLVESLGEIEQFATATSGWVIEGCYGDLIEGALPHCTEVIFLNPGTETCIRNCLARPWEPEKYASREEQDAKLEFLLTWVREYETRQDEFSLARHREIYERFRGRKREIVGRVEIDELLGGRDNAGGS